MYILEDLFSSVLSQFKKYHPSGNLEFIYLDIFPSLKLRILMEKIFSISLKLNFTPNTSGCYGLNNCFKDSVKWWLWLTCGPQNMYLSLNFDVIGKCLTSLQCGLPMTFLSSDSPCTQFYSLKKCETNYCCRCYCCCVVRQSKRWFVLLWGIWKQ